MRAERSARNPPRIVINARIVHSTAMAMAPAWRSIRGIIVVDFIFTKCPGICPVMTNKMSELYQEYADENMVQFVSFSVDPARDSLQALVNYALKWHVNDQRWYFLRTEKDKIQNLYEQGFKLGGELPYGHSGAFVLVDHNGIIRGYYDHSNNEELELLRRDIEVLLDEI